MTESRPSIPRPVKRAVRQRCGFGCVVCGLPIYEYEHVLGWANVRRHREDEIVLLCPLHHAERTKGLLTNETFNVASESPFNLRGGVTAPYALQFSGKEYLFDVGTIRFSGSLDSDGTFVQPVRIDGTSILGVRLEDSHFLLNLYVASESGQIVLAIIDNELIFSSWVWDAEFVGRRIIVREGHGKILIDLEFNSPGGLRIRRGRLLWNGIELMITERWSAVLNNRALLSDISVVGCTAGLVLGSERLQMGAAFRMEGIQRRGWNRAEAVRWVKEAAINSGLGELNELSGIDGSK